MEKANSKALQALKYLCISVALIAAAEASLLSVAHWLHVKIPFAVTVGLMMGVIGYFSNKLFRS